VPRGTGRGDKHTHADASVRYSAHIESAAPRSVPPPPHTVHANRSCRHRLSRRHCFHGKCNPRLADCTCPPLRRGVCLLRRAGARTRRRRVGRLVGTVGGMARVSRVHGAMGLGRRGGQTLAMQEERFPASWRARDRRRSYSASLSLLEAWLKAVRCWQVVLP